MCTPCVHHEEPQSFDIIPNPNSNLDSSQSFQTVLDFCHMTSRSHALPPLQTNNYLLFYVQLTLTLAKVCPHSRLITPLISGLDMDIVKTPVDIYFDKVLSILELQDRLRNQRKQILVLNSYHIENMQSSIKQKNLSFFLIKDTSLVIRDLKEHIQLVQRFSVRKTFNSDYSAEKRGYTLDNFRSALGTNLME